MNIRQILETNFPPTVSVEDYTPEVSNEGLMDKVKEFFRRPKKITKTKVEDEHSDIRTWVDEELSEMKLDEIELVDGELTIGSRLGTYFQRNGTPIKDVVAEFRKDVDEYDKLLKTAKGPLQAWARYLEKAQRETAAWLRNDPKADKPEEFKALIDKLADEAPRSLREIFAGYARPKPLLGFSNTPMIGKSGFEPEPVPDKGRDVTLPAPTNDEVKEIVGLLKKLDAIQSEAFELEDAFPMELDVTDPPFRAYADMIFEEVGKVYKFLHPIAGGESFGILNQIELRARALYEALATYLKKSIKK